MFIDEIQAMQERGETLRKLSNDATEQEFENLLRQLQLLDRECPRYDVYNVFSALNPHLVNSDSSVAVKRNAELIERRNDLLKIASKAPMGPPWFAFSLEHRCNERQRIAYLVRAVDENGEPITDLRFWHRRWVATAVFDSVRNNGGVEYAPNAFELLLNDDDEFASFQYDSRLVGANVQSAQQGAELVKTCIQLLNWDREDVPLQTLVNSKHQKRTNSAQRSSAKGDKRKTDPTVIKFEPFLKSVRSGTHRSSVIQAPAGEHLVKGHYINVQYAHPLFGHKPVLGKTYGRIWIRPHKRGNPEHGKLQAPRGVIAVGNVTNPNASQPVIPFPAV
jgi:hypothetical protein